MGRGRYVRVGDGPVVLVDESLRDFSADPMDWVDRNLVSVSSREVVRATVSMSNQTYSVQATGNNQFALEDLKEGEEPDTASARSLANALSYLSFQDVADPRQDDEEYGFGRDEGVASLTLETTNGTVYTASVSEEAADENSRYVRFSVDFEPPPPPTRADAEKRVPDQEPAEGEEEEEAETKSREERVEEELDRLLTAFQDRVKQAQEEAFALDEKIGTWTYAVANYTCNSMTLPREKLVKEKEPEEDEEAGDENAGATAPQTVPVAVEPTTPAGAEDAPSGEPEAEDNQEVDDTPAEPADEAEIEADEPASGPAGP
jgi:hypothetical protein